MKYIVFDNQTTNGEKVTERISKALFNLVRPEAERNPEDVTNKVFNWIEHPTTGELALVWDDHYVLNLHQRRNSADLIQLYININRSTNNRELREIKNIIDNNTTVTAGELISKDFILKEYSDMVAGGWFPEILN